MATVRTDIIAESTLSQTQNTLEMTRVYRVTGIPNTEDTAFKKTSYALLLNDIPDIGDNLGTNVITSKLFVTRREAKDIGHNNDGGIVEVVVNYSTIEGAANPINPNQAIWSTNDDMEEVQTNVDRLGNRITVSHEGVSKGTFVTRRIYIRTLTARRVEIGLDIPALTDNLVGKANSLVFLGYEAGRVICTRVTTQYRGKIDGQQSYETEYEFKVAPLDYRIIGINDANVTVYKSETGYWNPVAVWTDDQGEPPDGLVPGTGMKEITWMTFYDFNSLNLGGI